MKSYVVCFAFTPDGKVILIRKNRPEWQAGKLNGVGGKIEEGESVHQAAVREFFEETGAKTKEGDWRYFCYMSSQLWGCYCLSAENITGFSTTTDEVVDAYDKLPDDVLPNLLWLVPLAKQRECFVTAIY